MTWTSTTRTKAGKALQVINEQASKHDRPIFRYSTGLPPAK